MTWSRTVEDLTSPRVPRTATATATRARGSRVDHTSDLAAECGLGLSRRRVRELAARHGLAPLDVADVAHQVILGDALRTPRGDAAPSFVHGLGARECWATGLERLWTQCTTLAVTEELQRGSAATSASRREHCALVRAHRLFSLCQVAGVALERMLSAAPHEARAVLGELGELDASATSPVTVEGPTDGAGSAAAQAPSRKGKSAHEHVRRLRMRVGGLLALTCLLTWSLAFLHDNRAAGGDAAWPLVLFGCSVGSAALLSRGGRRTLQGAALWLGSAGLILLAEGGAASIMLALIGVLVLTGTTSFASDLLSTSTPSKHG